MKILNMTSLLFLLWYANANVFAAEPSAEPQVLEGYVVAPIPGQQAVAGYLTIHNPAAEAVVLLSVSSPAAAHTSLHESRMVGNLMSMQALQDVQLQPGETLVMAAGGMHLMLMNPNLEMFGEESVSVVLNFEALQPVEVEVPVRDLMNSMHHH